MGGMRLHELNHCLNTWTVDAFGFYYLYVIVRGGRRPSYCIELYWVAPISTKYIKQQQSWQCLVSCKQYLSFSTDWALLKLKSIDRIQRYSKPNRNRPCATLSESLFGVVFCSHGYMVAAVFAAFVSCSCYCCCCCCFFCFRHRRWLHHAPWRFAWQTQAFSHIVIRRSRTSSLSRPRARVSNDGIFLENSTWSHWLGSKIQNQRDSSGRYQLFGLSMLWFDVVCSVLSFVELQLLVGLGDSHCNLRQILGYLADVVDQEILESDYDPEGHQRSLMP